MTTNNRQKRHRATSQQLNVMVDFLLENSGLSSGNFQKLHGKYEFEKQWNSLAEKLNSLEGANKTGTQWYTVWRDLKFRTRIKVRNRRKHRAGNTHGPITALDKRVMDITGKNCKDRYEPVIQQIKIEEELQLEGEMEDKSNNSEISSPLRSSETEFVLEISDPLPAPTVESSPKRKLKEEDSDIWTKFLEISKIQADALKMIAESNVASLEIAKTHASVLKILAESTATNIDVNIKMTDAIRTLGEGLKHIANAFNIL